MPTWFNSNTFHNIANGLNVALAALTAVLMSSGCVAAASGVIDCSHSWIDPKYTVIAIGLVSVLKIAVNVGRDGWSGLSKPQPPVQK